jgi:hypothetical protein
VEIKDVEDSRIIAFESSKTGISEELQNYLKSIMADTYNKWCVDCKVKLSTHAIIFYGTFVCADCAAKIVEEFGFMATYPKEVLREHWDDFQLMAIARGCGGNRRLFEFLRSYELEEKDIPDKYNSRAFLWYQRRH